MLGAPDGMLISNDGKQLAVAAFNFATQELGVMYLRTDDKWESAIQSDFFATGFVSPTTLATDGESVYVIYSFVLEFFFGSNSRSEFIIRKVPIPSKKF